MTTNDVEDNEAARADAGALRRLFSALGLAVLIGTAIIGSNPFGVRDRLVGSAAPKARPAATARRAPERSGANVARKTELRSQPWWQSLEAIEGQANATRAVSISGGALQWRVKWTCETGRLVVRTPGAKRPVVDATCPGTAVGYATTKGQTNLEIRAGGPWRLQVEQQIDVPLVEPPLPAMSSPDSSVTTTGSLYRIDQVGRGRVAIYRLGDGSYALRLDDFYVTPNSDLEVRFSALEAPHSTDQYVDADSALVARLDVTAGALNFAVPRGVDPTKYRSVVFWCERLHSAYAAATLAR